MAPTITASTSTYLQRPGHLTSLKHHKKKKKRVLKTSQAGKSFQSKSGGLHNINLVLSTHERQHHRRRGNAAHIDLSDPSKLRKKDKARLAQLEKDIPVLNGVVPAGVARARRNGSAKGTAAAGAGKKKGKKFVEDSETMYEILRMVNEIKEVKVEEKLEKGRQLEALREARRKQQEARAEQRQSKLDTTKDALRKKRKRRAMESTGRGQREEEEEEEGDQPVTNIPPKKKKRVTFA